MSEKAAAPKKKGTGAQKLALWREAAKKNGFMIKGAGFKKMPKKGTDDYNKIRATYEQLLKQKGF